MALPWVVTVDGYSVNDGTTWVTAAIPEFDNVPAPSHVVVQMADDFPWYVRDQPVDGRYTLNIAATPCDDATFRTRLEALKAVVLTAGPHTLTVKIRGLTATKSLTAYYDGMAVAWRERIISISWYAPNPYWV